MKTAFLCIMIPMFKINGIRPHKNASWEYYSQSFSAEQNKYVDLITSHIGDKNGPNDNPSIFWTCTMPWLVFNLSKKLHHQLCCIFRRRKCLTQGAMQHTAQWFPHRSRKASKACQYIARYTEYKSKTYISKNISLSGKAFDGVTRKKDKCGNFLLNGPWKNIIVFLAQLC